LAGGQPECPLKTNRPLRYSRTAELRESRNPALGQYFVSWKAAGRNLLAWQYGVGQSCIEASGFWRQGVISDSLRAGSGTRFETSRGSHFLFAQKEQSSCSQGKPRKQTAEA
jgi:hypothetical protein